MRIVELNLLLPYGVEVGQPGTSVIPVDDGHVTLDYGEEIFEEGTIVILNVDNPIDIPPLATTHVFGGRTTPI